MNDAFKFLFATRFWALVIGAVSLYLKSKGWIGEAEMILIATITGGFITVQTVDRYSDKRVEAAKAQATQVTTSIDAEKIETVNTQKPENE